MGNNRKNHRRPEGAVLTDMRLILPACIILFLFSTMDSHGRDFHEPGRALDPFHGFYAKVEYNNHLFSSSDHDSFDLNTLVAATLWDWKEVLAVKLYYGSYLLVGPVAAGDTAPSIAAWWMNAVQFEYGLIGGFNLRNMGLPALRVTLEYGRTSQHPFRAGYSEVATDILRGGVLFPQIEFNGFGLRSSLHAAYIDLFDMWQSVLPKPRTKFLINPCMELDLPLTSNLALYSETNIDFNILRNGSIDVNWRSLAGLKSGGLLLYTGVYISPDSEEVKNTVTPVRLFGLGFRLSGGG